jgi:hypothetical protein
MSIWKRLNLWHFPRFWQGAPDPSGEDSETEDEAESAYPWEGYCIAPRCFDNPERQEAPQEMEAGHPGHPPVKVYRLPLRHKVPGMVRWLRSPMLHSASSCFGAPTKPAQAEIMHAAYADFTFELTWHTGSAMCFSECGRSCFTRFCLLSFTSSTSLQDFRWKAGLKVHSIAGLEHWGLQLKAYKAFALPHVLGLSEFSILSN